MPKRPIARQLDLSEGTTPYRLTYDRSLLPHEPLRPFVEITPFGALILAAATLLLLVQRTWLLALLPVCAVLQAPAAIILGSVETRVGITPFNVVVAACAVALLSTLHERGVKAVAGRIGPGTPHGLWATFFMLAAIAAWVMPLVFDGLPVHPLLAKGDVAVEPLPNHLSMSHVAQSINSIGLLVIIAWAASFDDSRETARLMCRGALIALAVSACTTFYHRGALAGWYELAAETWGSNPSYNQFFTSKYGPEYGRASLPFVEPSYASVWYAVMTVGFIALAAFPTSTRNQRAIAVLGIGVASFALVNTLGTSGMAAVLLTLPVLLLLIALAWRNKPLTGLLLVATICGAAICAGFFVFFDYLYLSLDIMAPVRAAIDFTWLKISWTPFGPRAWSTQRALSIAIETLGLGAGPGSTRASSYLVSLLANMGALGTGLFLLALLRQLRWLTVGALHGDTLSGALCSATLAAVIGAFGGIPDQNWPVFWMVLIAGSLQAAPQNRSSFNATGLRAESVPQSPMG